MIDGVIALYIFMLAAFTGYEVISRVPVILHTPLMSGSNFVHGIVLVGAMVALASADSTLLLLSGAPIAEPIVGYGPFVMNSRQEIETAVSDFQRGKFGRMPAVQTEATDAVS